MGLLTGVSKQGIDPMLSQLTPAQQRMEFGRQSAQGLQRAVRGMLGGGAPIQEQIQAALLEKQIQKQQELANLNITDIDSLRKLQRQKQAENDIAGVLQIQRQIEAVQKQEIERKNQERTVTTLRRIAQAQGKDDLVKLLDEGADPQIVRELLDLKGAPTPASALSEAEEDSYYSILEQAIEQQQIRKQDIPKLISKSGQRGLKKKSDLTLVFQRAKDLSKKQNISIEDALLIVSGIKRITDVRTSDLSPEATAYDTQDRFRGMTVRPEGSLKSKDGKK